ncbi:uncharacterized protein LOC113225292 [Piliocolobus tephrosceles]|uniref:uncharacterized protein LOC113225292 n=1 Tax=Piliocolobus tephrosceles TaxID=591936 RepID=UPI000E6B45B2|nr:uncharacterized protein LOC113225292 [Piliocolobus tephrosceles]
MQTGLRVSPMNRAVPDVFLAGGAQVPRGHTRRCLSAVESREQLEEEEAGEIKEGNGSHAVPLRRSGAFWAHGCNYDVFKRHSWGPGRELEDPLSRRRLQASGCPGPTEAPYLQNQEELDTFLGLQHQGGYPSRLGQDSCHPSAGPLDHSATGMLSKSVSMSGINCLLDWSDPDGNLSQSSAIDLRKRCSQLEGHSGTWAGSSLRRTFSFLLGMTGKAKVGVSWGSWRLGTHCPPQFPFSHPTTATSHHSPY